MCVDMQTDLVSTEFSREGDRFVAKMNVTTDVKRYFGSGYKEYYVWIDVNPGSRKGYQPYDPESVAWPDLYADYRIFYSLNANNDDGSTRSKIASQDCSATNCAEDGGLYWDPAVSVDIIGKTVTLSWPVTRFPKMAAAKNLKVGFTTYYEIGGACHGEDDSPQWGRNAWAVENPQPKRPPNPKAD
jgi:hypothetical protein